MALTPEQEAANDYAAANMLPMPFDEPEAMNLMDMPLREFQMYMRELESYGRNTDDLVRQYRAANSPLEKASSAIFGTGINEAAGDAQQAIADDGRRTVAGGLFSKEAGATGLDALRSLNFEGWAGLSGGLSGIGQAIDAPWAAANNLMPQGDMALEALGTAGAAMTGGGAATVPRGSLRAGLARNAAGTEGEQMARRILDMRAAGRASEVTDDMMAQADPQVMFNETPLPMDAASRAARATDAGFDTGTPLYHGTGADFQGFIPSERGKVGPGVYLTPEVDLAEVFSSENGRIIPTYATNNPAPMDVRTSAGNARRAAGMGEAGADAFKRELSGYDGVSVHDQRTILDPQNIRSQFARFDPEFAHLSNLSAANADYLTGLVASGASDEEVQAAYQMILDLEGPR